MALARRPAILTIYYMSDSNPSNQPYVPATISKPGNLLDAALANLPPEQRQALAQKALERKLDIDAEAFKADMRYHASSADMARDIGVVRALENGIMALPFSKRISGRSASGPGDT